MEDQLIKCPSCGAEFPLTEAITHRIEEGLRRQFDAQAAEQKKRVQERERVLKEKEDELRKKEASVAEQVAQELSRQKAILRKETAEEVRRQASVEMNDLKEQLKEKEQVVKSFQEAEMNLRKEKRQVEQQREQLELDLARRFDEERTKLVAETSKRIDEEHRLAARDKDKKIEDMLHQIEELKRKAEQGSQQAQGEVLELDLEEMLRQAFPLDEIAPVAKGVRGADVTQIVRARDGGVCGTILWECKRTKTWSNSWVEKLKDNQREMRAELAVIASEVLPEGVRSISLVDNVWVVSLPAVLGLATVLRTHLIQLAAVRQAGVGKNEKMEAVYNYLSGPQFKQRVEGIVEAFVSLRQDLDAEKRSIVKIWAKREKQIERVTTNTAGMYGDMQALVGASMQQIPQLELKQLSDGGGGVEVLDVLPEEQ